MIAIFPWTTSGRSLSLGRNEGKTKFFSLAIDRVIGGAIVGSDARDFIAEVALVIEYNKTTSQLSSTIHSHSTLFETRVFSAKVYEETMTDLYLG